MNTTGGHAWPGRGLAATASSPRWSALPFHTVLSNSPNMIGQTCKSHDREDREDGDRSARYQQQEQQNRRHEDGETHTGQCHHEDVAERQEHGHDKKQERNGENHACECRSQYDRRRIVKETCGYGCKACDQGKAKNCDQHRANDCHVHASSVNSRQPPPTLVGAAECGWRGHHHALWTATMTTKGQGRCVCRGLTYRHRRAATRWQPGGALPIARERELLELGRFWPSFSPDAPTMWDA
jgi:hypothetical protein